MTLEKLYDVWWQEKADGEQLMEVEHVKHWQKIIAIVEEQNIEDYSVLDFGCNQGSFLRYLFSERPFKEGIGVDLAIESVEISNQRKGNAPLNDATTS